MTIGARIRVFLGSILVTILALGVTGFFATTRAARRVETSLSEAFEVHADVTELRLLSRQTQLMIAAAAAAGTATDLANLADLESQFGGILKRKATGNAIGMDASELNGLMHEMAGTGRAFVAAEAGQQWAVAAELSPKFDKLSAKIRVKLEDISREQKAHVARVLADASQDLRRQSLYFGGGISLCVALGLLLSWSLQRRLVAPLGILTAATARIVQTGDLNQRIDLSSKDEIGELASSFSQLLDKLRQIPNSLGEATDVLTRCVSELSVNSAEQSRAMVRQATALQQTHVTASEIRQTSNAAAEKAEGLLAVVARVDEVSRAGAGSVERSLGGINEIGESVTAISERIDTLKERMRQIDAINIAVKDLADQSNMLALNAAIEAVRSGEHGKGFAVVAREIRVLADQSIAATRRIREILQDISRSIEEAASITAAGRTRMANGEKEIRASGEILRELAEMVKSSSLSVRQITTSVAQQNEGITQIFGAVNDLNEIARNTSSAVASAEGAIVQLETVTERVSGIVKSYRV